MSDTAAPTLDAARALVAEHGTVDLELVGLDGNAFAIMGAVQRASRHANWPPEAVSALLADMQSDRYDHLLQVAMVATGDIT